MTADIKLLPCPFCGGRADIVRGGADEEIWPHRAFSRAFCTGCQARQLFHKTDADAAAAWNIRANVAHHTAAKDAEIERLRVDVEAWKASHSLLTDTCHHFQARAKRLEESLRPTKEKLELIASVLGEAIAAHDEMLDEVGYSPFNRRRLDEAALAVVELHATEVWS